MTNGITALLLTALLSLGSAGNVFAGGNGGNGGGHGGGGAGGHGGFGGHASGAGHGPGAARFGHGAFAHGWGHQAGHGWHPGHGWGPGGWWRGRCCAWGGIGLGWFVPFLPWGYQTFWWDGVPVYYAGSNYYTWDDSAGEYQAVEPPGDFTEAAPAGAPTPAKDMSFELYAYPKSGQSEEQQARDREECRKWASQQSGFDPAQPPAGADEMTKRQGYLRAEAACLEARNYTVR
ncbi:MAG TPA: hypothetical protein VGL55_18025 [Steroidobacteraceae bacterium]|jgi:hypothetical protein